MPVCKWQTWNRLCVASEVQHWLGLWIFDFSVTLFLLVLDDWATIGVPIATGSTNIGWY